MVTTCPRSSFASRYAWPAALALAVHAGLLLSSGQRSAASAFPPADGQEKSPIAGAVIALAAPLPTMETAVADSSPATPAVPFAFADDRLPLAPAIAHTRVELALESRLATRDGARFLPDAASPLHSTATALPALHAGRRPALHGSDTGTEWAELDQLDTPPALLRVPEFEFPTHLSRQGLHAGRVTVLVSVNADGRVCVLECMEATHPDLIPAVRAAVPKALFQPPRRHGRRVALRYLWTLELKDRTHATDAHHS